MTNDPYQGYGQQPYGQQPYGQMPGQPQYGQQPYGYGYPPPKPPLDQSMSIIAFVAACSSIITCCLGSIVAVVVGHIALSKIKKGEATGKGLATAAVIIGYVVMVLVIALYALGIAGAILENANR